MSLQEVKYWIIPLLVKGNPKIINEVKSDIQHFMDGRLTPYKIPLAFPLNINEQNVWIWKEELPKITGWYWFRDNSKLPEEHKCVHVIVEPTNICNILLDNKQPTPGLWCGPIPEPKFQQFLNQ